jgi:hypothetical protein
MSDVAEPAFDVRLEGLRLRLVVASDVNAVLAVRKEIAALVGEAIGDVELLRQARELQREASTIVGDLLLSLAERGLRRHGGGDQKRGSQAGVPALRDFGFKWRTASSRWQRRARALPMPTFNRRLAEADSIAAIKALMAEATLKPRQKQKGRDAERIIAAARRLAARRAGGLLLLAAPSESGAGSTGARWKQLARLSEPEFLRAVEHASKAAMVYRAEPVPQIVMMRSGWVKDERGNACRRVYAAGDGDGMPAHR